MTNDQIEITNINYEQTLTLSQEDLHGPGTAYKCSTCGGHVTVYRGEVLAMNKFNAESLAKKGLCLQCVESMPRTMKVQS